MGRGTLPGPRAAAGSPGAADRAGALGSAWFITPAALTGSVLAVGMGALELRVHAEISAQLKATTSNSSLRTLFLPGCSRRNARAAVLEPTLQLEHWLFEQFEACHRD